MTDSIPNRKMTLLSAVNNLVNLPEAKRSHNLFEFQTPIRANDKRYFIDEFALFKAIQRMRHDRFSSQEACQFVQAHATAASCRNNNRGIHERILCTTWLKALPSALPAALSVASFITAPICAFDVAPT